MSNLCIRILLLNYKFFTAMKTLKKTSFILAVLMTMFTISMNAQEPRRDTTYHRYSDTTIRYRTDTVFNNRIDTTVTPQVQPQQEQQQPQQPQQPQPQAQPAVPQPQVETSKPADEDVPSAEFGFRFAPTFSSFNVHNAEGGVVKGEFALGYGLGIDFGQYFNKHVGLQEELIYNSLSQKFKDQNLERVLHINYINIPVLLALNTDRSKMTSANVMFGPQLGINVGSRLDSHGNANGDTVSAVLAVKTGDLGFAYGAGLGFLLNPMKTWRLDIGYRGVVGLLDISDHSETTTTSQYYILDRAHVRTGAAYIGFTYLF
jgi:hypothetical protein